MKLRSNHVQAICSHAESTYPDECCGILLGRITADGRTLVEIWQAENNWDAATDFDSDEKLTTKRRYAIAPELLLQAQRWARDRSLSIIGIYHSHPDSPAVPSECDLKYAWQEYSYLIVSVQQGKASDLLCWSLNEHHYFQPEAMLTVA